MSDFAVCGDCDTCFCLGFSVLCYFGLRLMFVISWCVILGCFCFAGLVFVCLRWAVPVNFVGLVWCNFEIDSIYGYDLLDGSYFMFVMLLLLWVFIW